MNRLAMRVLVAAALLLHGAFAWAVPSTRSSPPASAAPRCRSVATSPSSSRPAPTSRSRCCPPAGSAENVQRLRYEPGVKLALVQSDVYQAFLDQAAAGNAQAST